MILIVGLGNPGKEFKNTRHNTGFMVIDRFAKENGFFDWSEKKKFFSEISEGKMGRKKTVLAKPQTFMNDSGKAVKLLVGFYKIKNKNLWVVHDDLDLPLGGLKISMARGAAGHKGVRSIIDNLGKNNFLRFRVGTERTGGKQVREAREKFVLGKFTTKEKTAIKKAVRKTCQALKTAIEKGTEKAMNEFN